MSPRVDYGDPQRKLESPIKHLRELCPGTWTYKHPSQWVHESGVVVRQSLDYTKSGLLWFGHAIGLAKRDGAGWNWFPGGERTLQQMCKLKGN
jgi:hypothetical protein